jgi:hypothetical protein
LLRARGRTNGNLTQGGESGVCTIGTLASLTNFYTSLLPTQGWHYSAPPAVLTPCFHPTVPAQAWWIGSSTPSATFSWANGGNAGSGSIFWSYGYCQVR